MVIGVIRRPIGALPTRIPGSENDSANPPGAAERTGIDPGSSVPHGDHGVVVDVEELGTLHGALPVDPRHMS